MQTIINIYVLLTSVFINIYVINYEMGNIFTLYNSSQFF